MSHRWSRKIDSGSGWGSLTPPVLLLPPGPEGNLRSLCTIQMSSYALSTVHGTILTHQLIILACISDFIRGQGWMSGPAFPLCGASVRLEICLALAAGSLTSPQLWPSGMPRGRGGLRGEGFRRPVCSSLPASQPSGITSVKPLGGQIMSLLSLQALGHGCGPLKCS